jgi:hypothetical protein
LEEGGAFTFSGADDMLKLFEFSFAFNLLWFWVPLQLINYENLESLCSVIQWGGVFFLSFIK